MSIKKVTCLALLSLSCSSAFAINGAFDFGFSTITRGMAGAGSALPQDSLASAINPAGLTRVKKQFDVGAAVYFPDIRYSANTTTFGPPAVAIAGGEVKSNVSLFFLPNAGVNLPIDEKSTFGVALYSLAGFGNRYDTSTLGGATGTPGVLGDSTLRSDLKQAITSFTYARQITNKLSLGASLLVGLQTLNLRGLSQLSALSGAPAYFSNKGTDYSIGGGARLGLLYQILDNLDFSASYQPKVYMTRFSKYKGILADGGSFDMPAYGNLGLAWHITPQFVLAGDVQKIWFRDIPAYGNNHDGLLNGSCTPGNSGGPTCFGGKNGVGFNWNNALIYKIGAQWQVLPHTTLRAGYNHSNEILNSGAYAIENLIVTGALVRDIYTMGLTQVINDKNNLNLFVVYIPKHSLTNTNPFAATAQSVTFSGSGVGFGFGWSRTLA